MSAQHVKNKVLQDLDAGVRRQRSVSARHYDAAFDRAKSGVCNTLQRKGTRVSLQALEV